MSPAKRNTRVSVILPTHNRPELLREAVASLGKQTYQTWNAVVVDDASTPPAEAPSGPKFQIIRNAESVGGAASKNIGIGVADGEVLAFLDDDDLYEPTYLERAVEVLDAHPSIDVVFMGVSWFGTRQQAGQSAYDRAMRSLLTQAAPTEEAESLLFFDEGNLFKGLLKTIPMAFQRPVVRRRAFDEIGQYQPDILLWDCDWALRAALKAKCALLTGGLYLQRAEGQGFSSQQDRRSEHIRSNILMKERLLSWSITANQRSAVKDALSDLWFSMAWSNYRNGKSSVETISLLWKSAQFRPRIAHLKLLVRLALKPLWRPAIDT